MLYSLDNICISIVRGPFGSALKKEYFVDQSANTYKVYEQGNAIRKEINYGHYFITEEKFKELKRFEVAPLDFIMSCSGTIGELYQLPADSQRGVINQALLKMTVNNKIVDDCYFSYLFKYNLSALESKGTGIQNIASVQVLKRLTFDIPSKERQKHIVATLNAISTIIDKRRCELAKLDEVIKARFVEMFSTAPTVLVENACESYKIGPFGSALHKTEISSEGYAFVLGTDNAVKNEFAYKEIRYINKEKYKELEKYKVESGDVIMSMMGTVGRVAVIPHDIGTAIISSHLCILRVNKSIMYPDFFHLAFCKDDAIQHQIECIHNGSIMKGFNLKIVKAFNIACPELAKQKEFLEFVQQVKKSKTIVEESLKEAQMLFDSLMQKYFG